MTTTPCLSLFMLMFLVGATALSFFQLTYCLTKNSENDECTTQNQSVLVRQFANRQP
jgi:hypothetical protein